MESNAWVAKNGKCQERDSAVREKYMFACLRETAINLYLKNFYLYVKFSTQEMKSGLSGKLRLGRIRQRELDLDIGLFRNELMSLLWERL